MKKKAKIKVASGVERMFGSNVFGREAMRKCLDAASMRTLERAAQTGEGLDSATAEAVAVAMRDWALERGATHYAHVFYPLNGQTAEKHESMFAPGPGGSLVVGFNGKCLKGSESDGSSFPSGGLRTTFEARGETAWDVRCPPYLVENPNNPADVVLAIPSTFATAHGESLDEKTPLARSSRALARQAERVLALLGIKEGPVFANAGVEQEYFLVDREFYMRRPDLMICGRTLMGTKPPKGQEFADQYFGAIPERVKAYMLDFEQELWKLGITAQTRHNEVAPSQYEFVSYFERDFMASDHNHIVMQVMQRVAEQHGFACLLHEKPFAGVNGSGKHVNWSVHTEKRNLFKGGADPSKNLPFLVFMAAVIMSVHKYAKLFRTTVASAGNDHRLGAHEAPPAILSIFLGETLTGVMERMENETNGTNETLSHSSHSPSHDDRNRTSPFAYMGSKFEIRSVGSSQPISAPLTVLNTALAESLDLIARDLESALPKKATAKDIETAARKMVGEIYKKHGAVVFNGDGYSAGWKVEAHKRGLPEITNSVEATLAFARPEHVALFETYGVMTHRETASRSEVYFDRYVKQVATESAVCLMLAEQHVLAAAYRHQGQLASTAAAIKTATGKTPHTGQLDKAIDLVHALEHAVDALRATLSGVPSFCSATNDDAEQKLGAPGNESALVAQAIYCRDAILPAMKAVRIAADAVEITVAADLWTLPAYSEMLFIK